MVNKLGAAFGKFKFSIFEKITTHDRNLIIIDREYRSKIKTKKGRQFIANEKYYLYKCLDCGNEDWIVEYSLDEKQHCGCNACCVPPKKIVAGINDITTTAPWMVKYFKGGANEASKYSKYSKNAVDFICPDCGRVHTKQIQNVMANGTLSCVCSDSISYPNKFMYALLSELNIQFETEKNFDWSNNRRYDFYIPKFNTIIEMNGIQHYENHFKRSRNHRTLEEEFENDKFKKNIATENGIVNYFIVDCRKSECEFIKESILFSGLLNIINPENKNISWQNCACFATSNFAKRVCNYKRDNPTVTLHQIAEKFKIAYQTVLRFVKSGNKYNWCNYTLNEDLHMLMATGKVQRGQKPIYCIDTDMFFRTANLTAQFLSSSDKKFSSRQIRQSITKGKKYFGYEFKFITQEEFNEVKTKSPSKVVGDFFYTTT